MFENTASGLDCGDFRNPGFKAIAKLGILHTISPATSPLGIALEY